MSKPVVSTVGSLGSLSDEDRKALSDSVRNVDPQIAERVEANFQHAYSVARLVSAGYRQPLSS